MTDAEFLAALERCELPPAEFTHRAHIRAAYLYLRAHGFGTALERVRAAILAYARYLGAPGKYHETITVAYVALIGQHLGERGDGGGWEGFERDNPELFAPGLLLRYYGRDELGSELARRTFLLPRQPVAPAGATADPLKNV